MGAGAQAAGAEALLYDVDSGEALLATGPSAAAGLDALRSPVGPAAAGLADRPAAGAQWTLGRPAVYGVPASIPWLGLGETKYRTPNPPTWKSRPSVSILSPGWSAVVEEEAVRKRNAARLLAGLRPGGPLAPPESTAGADPGYLRLLLVSTGERPVRAGAEAERLEMGRGHPRRFTTCPSSARCVGTAMRAFPAPSAWPAVLLTHGLLTEFDLCCLEEWLGAPAQAPFALNVLFELSHLLSGFGPHPVRQGRRGRGCISTRLSHLARDFLRLP